MSEEIDMGGNVYIVEDNDIVRDMLSEFVSLVCNLEVCGSANSAEQALEELHTSGAELVLVDVSLPTMSGIELVHELSSRLPDLACLVVSGHQETTYVHRAFAAGARGYVVKGNPDDLKEGLEAVLDGGVYISPSTRRRMSADPEPRFARK